MRWESNLMRFTLTFIILFSGLMGCETSHQSDWLNPSKIQPAIHFSCAAAKLDIAAGSYESVECKVMSLGRFEGQVNFSCKAIREIRCSWNPERIVLKPSRTVTVEVTFRVDLYTREGMYRINLLAYSGDEREVFDIQVQVKRVHLSIECFKSEITIYPFQKQALSCRVTADIPYRECLDVNVDPMQEIEVSNLYREQCMPSFDVSIDFESNIERTGEKTVVTTIYTTNGVDRAEWPLMFHLKDEYFTFQCDSGFASDPVCELGSENGYTGTILLSCKSCYDTTLDYIAGEFTPDQVSLEPGIKETATFRVKECKDADNDGIIEAKVEAKDMVLGIRRETTIRVHCL